MFCTTLEGFLKKLFSIPASAVLLVALSLTPALAMEAGNNGDMKKDDMKAGDMSTGDTKAGDMKKGDMKQEGGMKSGGDMGKDDMKKDGGMDKRM